MTEKRRPLTEDEEEALQALRGNFKEDLHIDVRAKFARQVAQHEANYGIRFQDLVPLEMWSFMDIVIQWEDVYRDQMIGVIDALLANGVEDK